MSGFIKVSSSVNASFTVDDTNLGYMLGFRSNININTANNCYAGYLYNLAQDMYLNVFISNLNVGYSPNTNMKPTSFQVPINAGSFAINYSAANLSYEGYVAITNPNTPISHLLILVYTIGWVIVFIQTAQGFV